MSESENKHSQDSVSESSYNFDDVEKTQKIDMEYEDLLNNRSTQRSQFISAFLDRKKISTILGGKSIFMKKSSPDEFVKSESVVSLISSVPKLEKELKLPDVHDNYELKEKIAEGSQGTVWTAFDKSLKRDLIVKSIKPDRRRKDAGRDLDMFVSEARIMAQLDHSAIAPVFGMYSDTDNKLHLTMKHIHGKNLKDYLQEIMILYQSDGIAKYDERDSISTRIEYVIRVCEAVDYAHCKGVVHRDLKPENIIVGSHGEIYVMDWGLACLLSPDEQPNVDHVTDIGMHPREELVGTPCYMAPELIRGGLCSPQTDIFALGMILFEVVTLNRAVPGTTLKEVLQNIVNKKHLPFRHRFLKGKFSDDLKAIYEKATSHSLSRRYKRAGDMARDLKSYLMHKETSARPDNSFRKSLRAVSNHGLITASVILSVLLCSTSIALYSLYRNHVLVKEQRTREAVLNHFQHGVLERAGALDHAVRYFGTQLTNLAHHAQYVLCTSEGINRWLKFHAGNTLHGQAAANKAADSSKSSKITRFSGDRETVIKEILKHMMFASNATFKSKAVEGQKEMLKSKAPILQIFIALKDGVVISYPQHNEYPRKCNPRIRPCFKEAENDKGSIIWSMPFFCKTHSKLVTCCLKRIDENDKSLMGVVGIDIDLEYMNKYLEQNSISGLNQYLINKEGQVVLGGDSSSRKLEVNSKTSIIKLRKFVFAEQLKKAVEDKRLQFEMKYGHRNYIFGMRHIPSLDCYYVEQIPEDKLFMVYKNHVR